MPRLGSNMPPPVKAADDLERVEALLERCPVGGLLLFNGTAEHTPEALAALQNAAPIPLLIGSDIERGAGQQLAGATVFPHAMAFGNMGEGAEEALREAARITAREARACGLHMSFAPVADVNRNPRNPIIATRAFGTETSAVARLASAYVEACRKAGLLTVAKHAPGHGGTSADSHAELPVVDDPAEVLEATDLPPFRAAIEAGVDALMTAHVAYPALDPEGRPATASPPILQGVLRERLGFEGVIMTDSLLMAPIREAFSDAGAQAVALVKAGIDLLLDPPEPEAALQALVEAVEEGTLAEERLEAAARRVIALKRTVASRGGREAFLPASREERAGVGSQEHEEVAWGIAREAMSVEDGDRGWEGLMGFGEGALAVLVCSGGGAPHPLEAELEDAFPGCECVAVEGDPVSAQALIERAKSAPRLLVILVVQPAAWQSYGLSPAQRSLVEALLKHERAHLVSLGNPDVLRPYQDHPHLCTYSDVPASRRALLERLTVLAGR